jgi:hypothetical protein
MLLKAKILAHIALTRLEACMGNATFTRIADSQPYIGDAAFLAPANAVIQPKKDL